MIRSLRMFLIAGSLVAAAACGGDDDRAGTDTSAETTTDAAGVGDPELCAAVDQIKTMFDAVSPDDVTGMVAAITNADAALDSYVEHAPDDLKDEATVLVEGTRDLGRKLAAIKDDPDASAKARTILEETQTEEILTAEEATNAYEATACPEG